MNTSLVKDFDKARVPLELLSKPMEPDAPDILQMDVESVERIGERVCLWPGAQENEVEVLNTHRDWGQLVLRMHEPRRRFERVIERPEPDRRESTLHDLIDANSRFVRENGTTWTIESWTRDEERRFLVGYDEAHLFIAQIPWGSTVRDAHSALKPQEVRDAELRWPGMVQRQGEWFFVPLRPQDRISVQRHEDLVTRDEPIQSANRPHVATVRLQIRQTVFVRGEVRHDDHRTTPLPEWRRVVRNAAIASPWPGLLWVD